MDAVALGDVAHGRVLEAEAGGAALGVLGVQVKVAQLTPEGQRVRKQNKSLLINNTVSTSISS